MRPVVITANLLLVVLMSMSASAWTPEEMCRTKYPATPCKVDYGAGWYQFGPNRCVKAFHKPTMNFDQAEKECQKYKGGNLKECRKYRNGDLVSIHSLVELCQVECAMYRTNTGKAHYWIGLRKASFGFGFRAAWTDSSAYDFSHWARGQPDLDIFTYEECVEMNYNGWGLWNDQNCGDYRSFVCAVRYQ